MSSPGGAEVGRVTVRVLPDTSDFRRRVREQLERATEGLEARVGVNVDLDASGVRERMRALLTEVRAQAAGGVDINVGLDQSQVGRIAQSIRGLGGSTSGASSGIGGLSRNMYVMLAVLTLIGPAITLVSGLLAGLPSLLFAAGAGAGVIALGFDGIKRAAASLGPPIDALKQSLSETFEQRLTPQFEKLAGFIPKLRTGFTGIANGLSDMTGAFIDTVTTGVGLAQVNAILRGTGQLFKDLAPFTRSFTGALLTLGGQGAASFGYLSGSLQMFGNGFKSVVDKLASDGSLTTAFKGLSDTFDGLGQAFNDVFEAGVRSMPKLGETLKVVLRQMGTGIADAIPGLTAFGDIMLGAFGFASRVIGGFFKGVGPALTRFADGMTSSLSRSGDAVSDFFEGVGEKFGVFLDWLREQIPVVLNQVRDFITALTGGDTGNSSVGTQFGQGIRDFFQWLKDFWDANGESIKQAIAGIVTGIVTAAPYIGTLVGAFIGLGTKVGEAKDKIAAFIETVATFVTDNVSPVVRRIADAFNFVRTAVSNALGAIGGFVSGAVSRLQAAGGLIIGAVRSAWTTVVDTIKTKVGEAVTEAKNLGSKIVSALTGFVGQMKTIGTNIVQGLIDGITSMAESVAGAARSVVQGAIDAAKAVLSINSPSRVFRGLGYSSAEGYIQGLDRSAGDVTDAGKRFSKNAIGSVDFSDISTKWADALNEAKIGDVPLKFLEATGTNLLSDIGISTDGALGQLVKQVTENHYSPTFVVNDLDEAMRKSKSEQAKQSLQYTRR